jgi:hypothetical protein
MGENTPSWVPDNQEGSYTNPSGNDTQKTIQPTVQDTTNADGSITAVVEEPSSAGRVPLSVVGAVDPNYVVTSTPVSVPNVAGHTVNIITEIE